MGFFSRFRCAMAFAWKKTICFYFSDISQNCHSAKNHEAILKARPVSEISRKIEEKKVHLFFGLDQHKKSYEGFKKKIPFFSDYPFSKLRK